MLLEQMYNEVQAIKQENEHMKTWLQIMLLYVADNKGHLPPLGNPDIRGDAKLIALGRIGFRMSVSGLQILNRDTDKEITSIDELPLL